MKHEYGKRIVPMTVKLNALKGHNASEGNKKKSQKSERIQHSYYFMSNWNVYSVKKVNGK
jgi:hypothetical protein